jgi:hypothetical protein
MKTWIMTMAIVCGLLVPACAFGAAKPELRISSITFSAPAPLKAGDVITVDLTGTPKCSAAFSVKNFISVVKMKEMSPGAYHGTVKVPKGKLARNAPLVGYLGYDGAHASPVQASRLVTVIDENEERLHPTIPPLRFAKPASIAEPDKLPVVKPENAPKKPAPTPPPAVVSERKPSPATRKIVITGPVDGGIARRTINVTGTAHPNTVVKVEITYSNQLSGLLRLAGQVASQNLSAGKNGEFKMGPIALDGPLATDGLQFTIKAYYPDRADHGAAEIRVTGKRD